MDRFRRLSAVDLNLLLVFRALDETRQVTRAARLLGLTQPALSHALGRLRRLLGDPLFVRTPKGMVRTPRAESLSPAVARLLDSLDEEILGAGEFDPGRLNRTFRIRTTDMLELELIPKLLQRCAQEAPGVRLATTALEFRLPKESLESGECDIAIAGFFGQIPDGFYQQKLFSDSFRCAVRKDHPRIGKQLSLQAYCEERHILIAPSGELKGPVDRLLAKKKKNRDVALGVSNFTVSGWMVEQSDAILTAPSRLVDSLLVPFRLRSLAPPIEIPKIHIVQVWHERNHADPGHKWIREKIRSILQSSEN